MIIILHVQCLGDVKERHVELCMLFIYYIIFIYYVMLVYMMIIIIMTIMIMISRHHARASQLAHEDCYGPCSSEASAGKIIE